MARVVAAQRVGSDIILTIEETTTIEVVVPASDLEQARSGDLGSVVRSLHQKAKQSRLEATVAEVISAKLKADPQALDARVADAKNKAKKVPK